MSPNPAPVTTTAEDAQEVAADLRKLIDSAPAHIWLDLGEGAAAPGDVTFRDLREVSWSEDNATDVGIKYVRAPVAVATSDARRAASFFEPVAYLHYASKKPSLRRVDFNAQPTTLEKASGWKTIKLTECLPDATAPALPIDFKQATDQGGWQFVPKEPTEAMHQAAVRTIVRCSGNADFPPRVYRAMLAAAPTLLGVADGDAVGGKSGGAE